jgi:hypothetical protein
MRIAIAMPLPVRGSVTRGLGERPGEARDRRRASPTMRRLASRPDGVATRAGLNPPGRRPVLRQLVSLGCGAPLYPLLGLGFAWSTGAATLAVEGIPLALWAYSRGCPGRRARGHRGDDVGVLVDHHARAHRRAGAVRRGRTARG